MNAIIGMTEIALNSTEIEKKNYALTKVEDASKHLLGIINDVLDMSKIEAGKFELTTTKLDLRRLIEKTASFVRLNMDAKRQRFFMNVDDNVPFFFLGDDQRLMQVRMNLLANAGKFTPEEGEIDLNISLMAADDDICTIRFEVTDSGIGMTSEQQSRIFNIFEQAESGTRRKFGGTGLGLSISKYIVGLMDGEIIVESEPEKGSRFIFTVIMRKIEEDPAFYSNSENNLDHVKNLENEFTGKRILLAEDIEINREILISLLDSTGLVIDCAANGREALEKYTADPDAYNLILMDMRMPEMDGIDATQRIREFEKETSRHVPIIAMTANVFREDIDACKEAGMDDHVGKPLEINIIIEKLRKYLFR
jgi:CheY-like chemotaxis protein